MQKKWGARSFLFLAVLCFPDIVGAWNPVKNVMEETLELQRMASYVGMSEEDAKSLERWYNGKSDPTDNKVVQKDITKEEVIFRPVNNSQSENGSENHKMIKENPSTAEVGYLSSKTIEHVGDFDVTDVKYENNVSSSSPAQSKTTEKIYVETAKYKVANIHACTIIRGEFRAVCATFENLTDKTLRGVIIKIYLYDGDGIRIGQVPLFEANVLPKEKVVFTSTIFDEIPAEVKFFKVLEVTEGNESRFDGV